MKKTSTFQNGLIWFGAGVSLAEVLTGTSFASLGFTQGFAAIVTGHVIGCILLFLAGLIGGRSGRSAMETVKMSFGQKGGLLFAVLNVLQLVGWTAIMIYDGALAAGSVFPAGRWAWCLVIGGLILLWILVGVTNLGWLNKLSMAALFLLTLALCWVIFGSGTPQTSGLGEAMSFGAAVELAVAMPLSWLPLISDYTREAEKPFQATAVSAIVYGLVSIWMYAIGMGAAIFTGESDIAAVMVKAGLGIAALVILILSTVTTTFLDAWSAGISAESISPRLTGKWMAVGAALLGTAGALNYGGFTDPAMDALLLTFAAAWDQTAAFLVLASQLLSSAPIAPVCFKSYTVLTHPGVVEGMGPSVSSTFFGVENWAVHLAAGE